VDVFPNMIRSLDFFWDNVHNEDSCQDYIHDADALCGNICDKDNHNDIFDTNSLRKEKMESRNMDTSSMKDNRQHKHWNFGNNYHNFPDNLIHYLHSTGHNTRVDCTQ
jgi:hypothetical protein